MDKEALKQAVAVILAEEGPLHAARTLVLVAFSGIKERDGSPYFNHLERVADGIDDVRIKPIGYLHDLIEDVKGWTFEDLEEIGFDAFTVDGVRAVTKKGGAYFDEMVWLSATPQAIPAKRSDLKDNSNILRLAQIPDDWDVERTRKYYLAWHYLTDVEQGKIPPQTPFGQWMAIQPPAKQNWDLLRKHSSESVPAAGAPAFSL